VALGAVTLIVGLLPAWLFLARRPEDLGLLPDGARPAAATAETSGAAATVMEARFSREQAVRTPAFWLLMLYTALVYPVQAGVGLHQAPHLIERGIAPTSAALIVGAFSLMSGVAAMACGFLPRRLQIRYPLAITGGMLALGALIMAGVTSPAAGYLAAGLFGFGIGGVLTLLPIAWADYFGRANFGAIRGFALSTQVLAQATGPLLSGALRDLTGDYQLALQSFAGLAVLSVASALAARPPRK
jgi:cyanate permease